MIRKNYNFSEDTVSNLRDLKAYYSLTEVGVITLAIKKLFEGINRSKFGYRGSASVEKPVHLSKKDKEQQHIIAMEKMTEDELTAHLREIGYINKPPRVVISDERYGIYMVHSHSIDGGGKARFLAYKFFEGPFDGPLGRPCGHEDFKTMQEVYDEMRREGRLGLI